MICATRTFASSWWRARSNELGGLDIVVCNAGRQQARESILDLTTEDFDATMKTNIYAPFWIIKAALPHLKPGSVIIGTTSEQAYDPSPDLYDYAQTKAATMNYVKSLAKQLGPKGIRVNGVAPGPIWTPLQVSGGASMEKLEKFGGQTPLGRPGQPAELASIYVQLAASDASYATGQRLRRGRRQRPALTAQTHSVTKWRRFHSLDIATRDYMMYAAGGRSRSRNEYSSLKSVRSRRLSSSRVKAFGPASFGFCVWSRLSRWRWWLNLGQQPHSVGALLRNRPRFAEPACRADAEQSLLHSSAT